MTTPLILPSPADVAALNDSPHVYLSAACRQAGIAHDYAKAGETADALEQVAGVERLLACYRRTVGAQLVVPADVLRVLARLASPEACRWEGRVCVTHSWGSDVGTCPHGEAQQLLGGAA